MTQFILYQENNNKHLWLTLLLRVRFIYEYITFYFIQTIHNPDILQINKIPFWHSFKFVRFTFSRIGKHI